MSCSGHCRDAEDFFGSRTARRELRRYRRRGPEKSTLLLLDALRSEHLEGASLLDVGGGVGVIQHELLREGLGSALQVDASTAYLDAARAEADRRGNVGAHTWVHGDFVALAPGLPRADVVTLDRVICCYPELERLLEAAVGKTDRVLGLIYPRERWGTRVALAAGNLWLRLRGSDFRVFLHPPVRVHAYLEEEGFRPHRSAQTFLWRVETYVTDPPVTRPGGVQEGSGGP